MTASNKPTGLSRASLAQNFKPSTGHASPSWWSSRRSPPSWMATTRHARWTQRCILFERGLTCANGKRTAPRAQRVRLSVATLIRTLNQRANWRELVGTPCGGPSHSHTGLRQLSVRLYEQPRVQAPSPPYGPPPGAPPPGAYGQPQAYAGQPVMSPMGQAALNAVRTMPPAAVGTSQMLYVPRNFTVRPS